MSVAIIVALCTSLLLFCGAMGSLFLFGLVLLTVWTCLGNRFERAGKLCHGFIHLSGAANDRFFHADTVACAAGAVIGNRVGRLP